MTLDTAPVQDFAKAPDAMADVKTLVIFADGTGNAFALRETNVWRLYGALDKNGSRQVARYIPGVGTASNRFVRMFDAATGFGVPSNVRKLYRFLCWNWKEGDRIFLFGFSRGAFTVRTLAGMVGRQGIMPTEYRGRRFSTGDMRRNVKGAWRAYRKATTEASWASAGPLVRAGRRLRDGCVWLKRALLGQPQHAALEAAVRGTAAGPVVRPDGGFEPRGVRIAFMGLFDTVEAFGLPVDELRGLFGWLFFPMRFANNKCSRAVEVARHALAVDEERLTFAEVGFDLEGLPADQSIEEMWFAGVHSDVGGGYPDDHVSIAPLCWIAREAAAAGLVFRDEAIERLAAQRFDRAPIHDSGGGAAAGYRYEPRRIGPQAKLAGLVAQKISDGVDGYAPIALDASVGFADGRKPPRGMSARCRAAIDGLVFWRRLSNRLLVVALLALAATPALAPAAAGGEAVSIPYLGWLTPWLTALRDLDWMSAALVGLAAATWFANTWLRDVIRDYAVAGWADQEPPRIPGEALLAAAARLLPRRAPDLLFLAAVAALAVLVVVKLWGVAAPSLLADARCGAGGGTELAAGESRTVAFAPDAACEPLGARLVEGGSYDLSVLPSAAFCDARIPAGTAGVASAGALRYAEWLRRADGPWLAPVVRIAGAGGTRTVVPEAPAGTIGAGDWTCPKASVPGPAFRASFDAPISGDAFLYANDVAVLPVLFYRNNSGAAEVTITRTR